MGKNERAAVVALAIVGTLAACQGVDSAPASTSAANAEVDAGDTSAAPAAAPATNDVGTLTIRRLNGTEYDNTVRDLLGDTRGFSATFPPDDGADGFTNVADSLTISPLLFESYEAAADKLAVAAVQNSRIVTCDPATLGASACASEVLGRLVKRAWRRPVAADELARLVAMVTESDKNGLGFLNGLRVALEATLLSPNFLFRIELDPDPRSTSAHALTDYELASRLSYFLWSSMPDDALFAYAEAGKLSEPSTFDREVRRMMKDPRATALIDNFASQWLLHTLPNVTPDATVFPTFDAALRTSMGLETKAFIASFFFGTESLADIFDAPFSFLDARMAAHYGVQGVAGEAPVRVDLPPGSHRGGILTHASVLTMTAVATRTSPVRRGEWVLSELLCSPPPPPPPGVPPLPEKVSVGTMRQRMEEHRQNPICATCHTLMDPIGFALEHYDAIGRWRDTDQGLPIDATGQLPGGKTVDGQTELALAIKSDPRFARCVTKKLYTYALGRVARAYDDGRLGALTSTFTLGGQRTRDLIVDIVHSDAFRMRHGGE